MTLQDPIAPEISFAISRTAFNEDYTPAKSTRATTNFANLARGEKRKENLQKTLRMINNRLNALAHWDNASADRYAIELDIISIGMTLGEANAIESLPLIELLDSRVIDRKKNLIVKGMTGNSFSSYIRDYDFSLLLPQHLARNPHEPEPKDFGLLHGKLFQHFLASEVYAQNFAKLPVICLSVSTSRSYQVTGQSHPILGQEFTQNSRSRTDLYFAKMGCEVRFFMPADSVAPLAFYFTGDLLADYSDLELISAIATMESFQKIYRPELYNANAPASALYRPSLNHQDYSLTLVSYDREERSQLARQQAQFTETHLMKPYGALLSAWSKTV